MILNWIFQRPKIGEKPAVLLCSYINAIQGCRIHSDEQIKSFTGLTRACNGLDGAGGVC